MVRLLYFDSTFAHKCICCSLELLCSNQSVKDIFHYLFSLFSLLISSVCYMKLCPGMRLRLSFMNKLYTHFPIDIYVIMPCVSS